MPGQTPPPEYPYEKIIKMLKKLFSIAHVPHITISGGEPTLFARLQELILFCRLKKKGITMISNGAGKPEDYQQLIKMGVSLFEFPVHSYDEKTHDELAGKTGAWKNAISSLKTVLQSGGQAVAVIVITRLNHKQVPETMRFIKSLGVERIMLNRFNIGGQGIKEKKVIGLTNDELRKVFAAANKTTLETKLTVTSNVCTPYCVVKPEDYPAIGFSACHPKEINRPWTLDPEGNVRFCNHSPKVVGNIYKTKFEEMLKTPYIKEWQETVPELCVECSIFTRCWAGCRAACEQLEMPLSYADPIAYEGKPDNPFIKG